MNKNSVKKQASASRSFNFRHKQDNYVRLRTTKILRKIAKLCYMSSCDLTYFI